MTTTTKDIEDLVNLRCSSIHFLELDTLLKKLDNEDLDVLYHMLEETYEDGEGEGLSRLEQRCQEQYDKGYADGYDDGFSTEE
jgi:hypothetical protein